MTPNAAVACILDAVLADLAQPKLYTWTSWAVDVRGFPVPTTSPAAVRWSMRGMVRRHGLLDEDLVTRTWAAIETQFPVEPYYERHTTEEDRVRIVQAARDALVNGTAGK